MMIARMRKALPEGDGGYISLLSLLLVPLAMAALIVGILCFVVAVMI